jgi:hypothetical protein
LLKDWVEISLLSTDGGTFVVLGLVGPELPYVKKLGQQKNNNLIDSSTRVFPRDGCNKCNLIFI